MFLLFEALGIIGAGVYGIAALNYHTNNHWGMTPITFKDFVASYNLNPKRWEKYKNKVKYLNDFTTHDDDEDFYFRTYTEYLQYKNWLTRHSTAHEKMMFWMKKDLAALPPANYEQEEHIQLAIDTINKSFPNIDNKFGYQIEE